MTPDNTELARPAKNPRGSFRRYAIDICVVVAVVIALALLVVPAIITRDPHGAFKTHDSNNLKQLAIAQLNHADSNRDAFVGPYAQVSPRVMSVDLSFRVSLLLYIEQETLYKQIDLTQPWDSPCNAPATSTAIRHFQSPDTPDRAKPDTPYRVFYGGGALFEADGKPVKLTEIPDGTSNTILFVHATETVPWAKPQEFAYTPTTPLPPLGSPGLSKVGFNVAFADGSVRFLRHTVAEADLRSLIEKADGRGANIE